jgi:hypothetical protein
MDTIELNTFEDVEEIIKFASADLPKRNFLLEMAREAFGKLKASGLLQSPTLPAIVNRIEAMLNPSPMEVSELKANQMFLIDEFANDPLEAIRLFEFGEIWKDGVKRDFTREFAKQMVLPHYSPAIKLGSHNDETKAGGKIVSLEVRDDGLYGIPEFNENGQAAINEKHYNYHSPEVIWDGWLEDPKTGDPIEGPIIAGLAFLHDPHLGESASLFSAVKPYKKITQPEDNGMTTENMTVPSSLVEKFSAFMDKFNKEDEPNDEPREDFAALEQERDDYKSKYDSLVAEQEKAAKLTAVRSMFDSDEHGEAFTELGKDDEAIEVLAGMDDTQLEWTLKLAKALSAQADPNITGELGDAGKPVDNSPGGVLNAEIKKYASENDLGYHEAMAALQRQRPELFTSAGIKK